MRLAPLSALVCLTAAVAASGSSNQNPPIVNGPFMVTAGKPATLTWKPTTPGPVTLTLRSGASSVLKTDRVIASGIDNSGSYTFTLPSGTTRNSDYTIEISDDKTNDTNYTPQFVVESTNTVESITSSASASATSTSTASGSTASTARSKSASSKISTITGSTTSSSSSSSTSSATGATTAAAAPSSGANVLVVQGRLVAMMIVVVAVY
ncbi:hypothetical protein ABVK25_001358 [Lepraria finkii]|uniref:Yeast cell wall synthesis Kre9/Knh1-like N-terminal domain-containing protein n=1 Tax=Lepraria finkii TaxID=1340010 RepID=A0ABR4BLM3_9LECA